MGTSNSPDVTAIVCCYNAEATIAGTLQSLLGQTHQSLRILVIDDASTDGSVSVAQSLGATDSRIKLLRNDSNKGIAATRMRGLKEAETDLVFFLDSDDIAEPEMLSRLVETMSTHTRIIGVGCYARYFNDDGPLGVQKMGPTCKEAFFDLYTKNKFVFISVVTLMDRQDALSVGGFRTNILPNDAGIRYEDFAEDLDLWCRMSDLGADGRYFVTIPEPLFRYRKPAGSLSTGNVRQMQLKMRWIKDCLKRRRAGLPERSLAEFIASRSWIDRLKDHRSDIAAKYYKKAGFAYSIRSYLKLFLFLGIVCLFSPKLIRQKMKTQSTKAK